MPDPKTQSWFQFFNEVAIIEQLARTMFEAQLPHGFVLPQFSVLNHLIRVRDGQTPLALARAFQVPKTSMSHSLGVLAQAGLIELRANPGDGRSKQVWITAAGRAFREAAIAALAPDIARISHGTALDDIADLAARLGVLRKRLDADRDRANPGDDAPT